MYDYLIIGLVCLFIGYIAGASVMAKRLRKIINLLPPELQELIKAKAKRGEV